MNKNDFNQSAAKPLLEEGSETIPQGSTLENSSGSATLSARKGGDDDIVRKRNLDKFINKAKDKFGDKFDYSKVEYVDAKTKVIIVCPIHGEFEQTPDKHLQSKYGCPECSKLRDFSATAENSKKSAEKRQMSKDMFIKIANEKYNNKYKYIINDWKGVVSSEITVVCPKHGEFTTNARAHIINGNTYGCPECANEQRIINKTQPYEDVISQLKEKYNNYYEYPEENKESYINKTSKIKVICPKHGEFYKSVTKHLQGQECFECTIERLVDRGFLPGGYSDVVFEENPDLKNIPAYLYYFKINNGEYYKIGISKNDPKTRVKSLKSKAKSFGEELNFEIIAVQTKYTLYKCYKIEQLILQKLNKFRIYRKWSTELFNTDIYKYIQKVF